MSYIYDFAIYMRFCRGLFLRDNNAMNLYPFASPYDCKWEEISPFSLRSDGKTRKEKPIHTSCMNGPYGLNPWTTGSFHGSF